MCSETTDVTEKQNIGCWNSVLQGMFQGTIRFDIFIEDTSKIKYAKKGVGVRADIR